MRCRNCDVQLMATDTHCPSCGSSLARATAAAPGEFAKESNGLLRMLPIFGGAAGGLLYGAIRAADTASQAPARRPAGAAPTIAAGGRAGGSSALRYCIGFPLLLVGGLLVYIGGREAWDARQVSQRPAAEVSAAELGRPDFLASAPDWIHFTFAESKPIAVVVKRQRHSGGGEADARCLLVRVQDKWLLASVPLGFQGNDLVGYLVRLDPAASRPLLEQIARAEPKVTALLPFEFNAVEGSAADQRLRQTAAGLLGLVGLVAVLIGACVTPFGSRKAATAAT
jgi:hypothetical protein